LEICAEALRSTEEWLDEKEGLSSADHAFLADSVDELKAEALNFAERLPVRLESEATFFVLNRWLKQLDPYSRFFMEEPGHPLAPSWELKSESENLKRLVIHHFDTPHLCEELKPVLEGLQADRGTFKLVLDLRGNPGGLVESAFCLAEMFVKEGQVLARFKKSPSFFPFSLSQEFSVQDWLRERLEGPEFVRRARGPVVFTKPLEIWMDRRSASASEILAAALRDADRVRIRGEKSYGKGCVQLPRRLEHIKGVKVMLTTYRWYRPSGDSIEATHGILPDMSWTL
jgi:hypothetical protein